MGHGLVLGALVGQRGGDKLVLGPGDGKGLVDIPQGSSPAFLIGAYFSALGARVVPPPPNFERNRQHVLVLVNDVDEGRAVGEGEDVGGQGDSREEGEEEFHGLGG